MGFTDPLKGALRAFFYVCEVNWNSVGAAFPRPAVIRLVHLRA